MILFHSMGDRCHFCVKAEQMFAEQIKDGRMKKLPASECKIPGVQGFPTFSSEETGKHTSGLPESWESLLVKLGVEGYMASGPSHGGHMPHHAGGGNMHHGHKGEEYGHMPHHAGGGNMHHGHKGEAYGSGPHGSGPHGSGPHGSGPHGHGPPGHGPPGRDPCSSNNAWMGHMRTHDPDPNTNGFNQRCRTHPAKPTWCSSNQQWMSIKGIQDPDPNTNGFNSTCGTHVKPVMCNSNVDFMRSTGTRDPDPHTNGFDAHCSKSPHPHHHPNPKPMWCESNQDWMRIKGTKDPDPHTNGFMASCGSHHGGDDQWCPPCKSRHQIDTDWCTPTGGPAAPVTSQEWNGVL